MLAGLLGPTDLEYLGAFNVPTGTGNSTFEYGGTAITYNPNNHSLFMVGHDWEQAVAEISIPDPTTGTLETLASASLLQPFSQILNRLPNNTLQPEETVKVGGLLVDGDELVGTAYEYYDGAGDAVESHFRASSLNLETSAVSGLFQVGDLGGGFVGGYMAEVPPEWQDAFGASHVTGQAALPIIGRTSSGPSLFGFDPAQVGAGVATATPLVYYPLDHPLAPVQTQNPLFNTTTDITGVVFPKGTDSVLFFGSHGVGPWWYGEADEGGLDLYRQDKGPHAPEYVYQAWAYNANDLVAVKNGLMQPWEVQPYNTWTFDLPYFDGGKHLGGVAYDSASGRLYVSQKYGNEAYPVVHAYQIGTPEPILNLPPSGVTLANLVHSLPEMTLTADNVKLADIVVADDGVGTNLLSVSGVDRDYFSIVGTSLFLNGGVQLDYETKAAFNVTVEASDLLLGGGVSVVYTLNVTDINDAPVLDNTLSPTLPSIQEDTKFPAGTKVWSVIHSATSDVDVAPLSGVAVTGASSFHGTWQSSLDGGTTWQAMGAVSEAAARLLPGWSQMRFLPKADFNGTVKLYYHSWDQTQGSVGGTFNLSGNTGGSKAFSTARGSAALTVTPVNDAPKVSLGGTIGYVRDAAAITLAPNASVSDIDSANFANGQLRVWITNGASTSNRLIIGSGFTIDAKNNVLQGSTIIGKRTSNGFGTKELNVTFNSRATPAIAQQLVRAIAFKTVSGAAGKRAVLFTVSDGDGGLSDEAMKQVNVT